MKNSNNIITILLAVAVAALFILHFVDRPKATSSALVGGAGDSVQIEQLPIAYVNLDSLLTGYSFSRDLQEKMLQKMEATQATINQQGRALENELAEFQRKIENNAFFDASRAEREQKRLIKKQQDFQQLNQKLSNEVMQEQQELNKMLNDTIMAQVAEFNRTQGGYQLIFTNTLGDNILHAEKQYDITQKVIDFLNSKYTPAAKPAE